jgi:DNA-binding transcriptional regulator PaaX
MGRRRRASQSDAFAYQDIVHAFGIVGSHSTVQALAMFLGLARGIAETVLLKKLYYLADRGYLAKSGRGKDATFALVSWPTRGDTVARKRDWSTKPWDGRWHLLTYDVPTTQNSLRRRLRRFLHEAGFGLLCASSWVSPYDWGESLEEMFQHADKGISACYVDASRVLSLGGETAPRLPARWHIERSAGRYRRITKLCRAATASTTSAAARARARTCLSTMREMEHIEAEDPMLPRELLPQSWPRPAALNALEKLTGALRRDLR